MKLITVTYYTIYMIEITFSRFKCEGHVRHFLRMRFSVIGILIDGSHSKTV